MKKIYGFREKNLEKIGRIMFFFFLIKFLINSKLRMNVNNI